MALVHVDGQVLGLVHVQSFGTVWRQDRELGFEVEVFVYAWDIA
jgi:hypothetical protein